jgi:hypothetical protein
MRVAGTVSLPQRRDPAGLVGWECVGSVLAASVLGVCTFTLHLKSKTKCDRQEASKDLVSPTSETLSATSRCRHQLTPAAAAGSRGRADASPCQCFRADCSRASAPAESPLCDNRAQRKQQQWQQQQQRQGVSALRYLLCGKTLLQRSSITNIITTSSSNSMPPAKCCAV